MRRKKKEQILEQVAVTGYAAEGKSLARIDGKVVFMENAVPGDVVDLRIIRNKKDWAEGRVLNYRSYSPQRVEPFCSHFGVCGGCQWQMLSYEQQLVYKQQQVKDALERIGKLVLPEMEPILGARATQQYRNKIEYTFSNRRFLLTEELQNTDISARREVAGFHAKGIFDKVVDIETCYLQDDLSNQLRKFIKNWGIDHKVSFYDIREQQGWLRTMQVRICNTGEVMLNIVLGYDDPDLHNELLQAVDKQFPQLSTILYTLNTKKNDSLNDLLPQVYKGKGYVIEHLGEFSFKIGPKSFFQTNSAQAENLYTVVREMAALSGREVVYDLYCGTGSIGIFVSGKAGKIIGVEFVKEAVTDAWENAALNNITQAHFAAGDVTEICNDAFFAEHGKPDMIITDPPRAGMSEKLISKILEMNAARIVYVSCNPATQARDLNLLDQKYQIKRIKPVDMFPHTHHIENVVLLEIRNG